jgi:hypothetical protein
MRLSMRNKVVIELLGLIGITILPLLAGHLMSGR